MIDILNPNKVKFLSGEYVNLPQAPAPDDILFFLHTHPKKKKSFNDLDLVTFFGPKEEIIGNSIQYLLDKNMIIKIEEDKYQLI